MNKKNFKKILLGGLVAIALVTNINVYQAKAINEVDPPVVFSQRPIQLIKTDYIR